MWYLWFSPLPLRQQLPYRQFLLIFPQNADGLFGTSSASRALRSSRSEAGNLFCLVQAVISGTSDGNVSAWISKLSFPSCQSTKAYAKILGNFHLRQIQMLFSILNCIQFELLRVLFPFVIHDSSSFVDYITKLENLSFCLILFIYQHQLLRNIHFEYRHHHLLSDTQNNSLPFF